MAMAGGKYDVLLVAEHGLYPPEARAAIFHRIRAYLTSVAYCSADNPAFYDLEHNVHFLDQLDTFINSRLDRRTPTVAAVSAAWLTMITNFPIEIHIHGESLNQLVKERGNWTHYWRDLEMEGRASRADSAAAHVVPNADLPVDVQNCMRSTNKMVQALQSQVSKLHNRPSKGGKGGKDGGQGRQRWRQRR